MGLDAYGVSILALTAVSLLQMLDGGMLKTALRYFAVSVGQGNDLMLARQLSSVTFVVLAVSGLVGAAVYFLAPVLPGAFHITADLRPAAEFATHAVAILIPLGLVQGVVSAVPQARAQFKALAILTIFNRLAYSVAVIVLVRHEGGIQTVMRLTVAQGFLGLVIVAPIALRSLPLRRASLLTRRELRSILAYSTRVQVFTLTSVVNLQLDTLIVGAVLPVRYVGIFGVASTFASQVRTVPLNAGGPLISQLARVLGSGGEKAALREFERLQALWGQGVGGFTAIALGGVPFGIVALLGPHFRDAGIAFAILTAGNLVNLLTGPMTMYLQVIGRPEVEVRYGLIAAGVNLLFTVSGVWLGFFGIVTATAIGLVVGSVSLIYIARREIDKDLPSFLTGAPWKAIAIAAAVAAACGYALTSVIDWHGLVALILVSLAWLPGGLAFVLALCGPVRLMAGARLAVDRRSLIPLIHAMLPAASA